MSGQSPLDRLARDPHTQAMIADVYTPDVVAHLKAFFDTWTSPTSPEEREVLLQRWMNPPLPEANDTIFGGQYIPRRLSETERIRPAHFLTSSQGFAELRSVLISPEYPVSIILAETLAALGHGFIPVKVPPLRNPKGGKLLEPIGITTLYMSFSEGTEFQDTAPPFFINFVVLNESPVEKGVFGIVANPDIERVFGTAKPF